VVLGSPPGVTSSSPAAHRIVVAPRRTVRVVSSVVTVFRPGDEVWFRGRPAKLVGYRRGRAEIKLRGGVRSVVAAGGLGRTRRESVDLALVVTR
jgi:hypothetical protein